MAVELILVAPLLIIFFTALSFFGEYMLKEEKIHMAARYAIWKVRETDDLTLPECYNGIEVTIKPSGVNELFPSNSEELNYDSYILNLFNSLANTANNTKRIEVSATLEVPDEVGFGVLNKTELTESLVIDDSTWSASDIVSIIIKIFGLDYLSKYAD